MSDQPLTPPNPGAGGRVMKIIALVAIGLVVCCGIAGSCLFALTLVAPMFSGTPTPAF